MSTFKNTLLLKIFAYFVNPILRSSSIELLIQNQAAIDKFLEPHMIVPDFQELKNTIEMIDWNDKRVNEVKAQLSIIVIYLK